MPIYEYKCNECGNVYDIHKSMSAVSRLEFCEFDGKPLDRVYNCAGITGTRDGFGVGKEFYDEKTGKVIDNYKTWEKAGFRDPLNDGLLDSDTKAGVKRKVEKIEKYDSGKKTHVMT